MVDDSRFLVMIREYQARLLVCVKKIEMFCDGLCEYLGFNAHMPGVNELAGHYGTICDVAYKIKNLSDHSCALEGIIHHRKAWHRDDYRRFRAVIKENEGELSECFETVCKELNYLEHWSELFGGNEFAVIHYRLNEICYELGLLRRHAWEMFDMMCNYIREIDRIFEDLEQGWVQKEDIE